MRFTRNKNRSETKIKQDIVDTKKITRDDIYDFLKGKDKKTRKQDLQAFLESIPDSTFTTDKKLSIDKIIGDIRSYD